MARKYATADRVDRAALLEFLRPRHRGLLATTRGDGSPGPVVDADLLAGFYDRAVNEGGVEGGPTLRPAA